MKNLRNKICYYKETESYNFAPRSLKYKPDPEDTLFALPNTTKFKKHPGEKRLYKCSCRIRNPFKD